MTWMICSFFHYPNVLFFFCVYSICLCRFFGVGAVHMEASKGSWVSFSSLCFIPLRQSLVLKLELQPASLHDYFVSLSLPVAISEVKVSRLSGIWILVLLFGQESPLLADLHLQLSLCLFVFVLLFFFYHIDIIHINISRITVSIS